MDKLQEKTSKFLSYILRHAPESIGLTLESDGWANIDQLIKLANQHGNSLTYNLINQVVKTNDKKRFTLSDDGLKIRAAQGHTTNQVNMNYIEQIPPDILFHGTASRFLSSIRAQGLVAGARHYVHLSETQKTAMSVGQRHGKPIVLLIEAQKMYQQGFRFYQADNGVWLTKYVPVEFIRE